MSLSKPNSQPQTVVCVGHSYITRLSRYCQHSDSKSNLGLHPARQTIRFRGKGGKYVAHLPFDMPYIIRTRPQLVCIDIASNDLDVPTAQPCQVATKVFEFAQQLISQGVQSVVIMEVVIGAV